jgi:hypothetical protein
MATRSKKIILTRKQKSKITRKIRKKKRKKVLRKKGYIRSKGGKYVNGIFWSKKCKKEFVFRSTYEFAYFNILEADTNVDRYLVEPFRIPYRYKNRKRNYIPDIMVLFKDGSIELIEVKPVAFLKHPVVRAKATAARAFVKRNIPNCIYKFITEKDIFETPEEYRKLLELIK